MYKHTPQVHTCQDPQPTVADPRCAELVITVSGCIADLPGCRLCSTDSVVADLQCPACVCGSWQSHAPFVGCQYKSIEPFDPNQPISAMSVVLQAEDATEFNDTTPGEALLATRALYWVLDGGGSWRQACP